MKIAAVINPGAIDGPVFIIATVLVAVNVILYLFIHQIQRLQKSRYELMLINERIAHEAKQAEEVNTVWNNIRKVRHDMLAGV